MVVGQKNYGPVGLGRQEKSNQGFFWIKQKSKNAFFSPGQMKRGSCNCQRETIKQCWENRFPKFVNKKLFFFITKGMCLLHLCKRNNGTKGQDTAKMSEIKWRKKRQSIHYKPRTR